MRDRKKTTKSNKEIKEETIHFKEIKLIDKVIFEKTEKLVVETEQPENKYAVNSNSGTTSLSTVEELIEEIYDDVLKEDEKEFEDSYKDKEDELHVLVDYLKKEQEKQEEYVKELQRKLANAVTMYERQEVRIKFMSDKAKKSLLLAALPMAIKPISKIATTVFMAMLTTAILKELLRVETETITKKVVEVEDFSREIVDSIFDIKDIKNNIEISMENIDRIKNEVQKEFSHLEDTDHYKDLFKSLEEIKKELEEKDIELNIILDEQDKNLDKNNEQIKLLKK